MLYEDLISIQLCEGCVGARLGACFGVKIGTSPTFEQMEYGGSDVRFELYILEYCDW